MTRQQHKPGIRWVRPPEFSNDLDVSELYVRLRADGEVTLTHEYRTRRGSLPSRDDTFWIDDHGAALARRAAEDGFKVGWGPNQSLDVGLIRRRTLRHIYWQKSRVLVLNGPLTREVADAASSYRELAANLVAELLAKGSACVPIIYAPNALLPGHPNTFLDAEIERLAHKAGHEVDWEYSSWNDIEYLATLRDQTSPRPHHTNLVRGRNSLR